MNNYELYFKFATISSLNAFDAYIELKQFKKEYKKSDFYKKTKMPLFRAYKIYCNSLVPELYHKLKDWVTGEGIGAKLTEILENIDSDVLFEKVQQIVGSFNLDNLENEKGELQEAINKLKILN